MLEDTAAPIGLTAAFIGVYLAHRFGNPYFDGAASILIGITLCIVSAILICESKGLLVGEATTPEIVASVTTLALGGSCGNSSEPGSDSNVGPGGSIVEY